MKLAPGGADELRATAYVNPRQAAFCGPQVPEPSVYAFAARGKTLTLAPKPSDDCADRDSILTGRWSRGGR